MTGEKKKPTSVLIIGVLSLALGCFATFVSLFVGVMLWLDPAQGAASDPQGILGAVWGHRVLICALQGLFGVATLVSALAFLRLKAWARLSLVALVTLFVLTFVVSQIMMFIHLSTTLGLGGVILLAVGVSSLLSGVVFMVPCVVAVRFLCHDDMKAVFEGHGAG